MFFLRPLFPTLLAILALWAHVSSAETAPTLVYPAGAAPSIVNVTQPPWNLDNTGQTDVTAQLQAVVDAHQDNNNPADHVPRILYFPRGTYLISDRIVATSRTSGTARGLVIIQGESRDETIIRLKNNCNGTGYNDPAGNWIASTGNFTAPHQPRPMLSWFEGDWTNNAFNNGLENITIDTGSGNPGAIAVRFMCNNAGYVRHVRLRSGDPARAGHAGLDLNPPVSGIGLVKHLIVEGFRFGIQANQGTEMPWVFEHISLSGQTEAGMLIGNRPISLRRLHSVNTVPAVRVTGAGAHLVILDSQLTGGSGSNAAIDQQQGELFLRNVTSTGYVATIRNRGTNVPGQFAGEEFRTGAALSLWPGPERSLNLPIAETPEPAWDPGESWIFVSPNGSDDTQSIRAAMATGKTTICFLPGRYRISDTIVIPPHVRRLAGQFAVIEPMGFSFRQANPPKPVFRLDQSQHDVVIVERFRGVFSGPQQGPLLTVYFFHHNSNADLVIRDSFWATSAAYRNTPGAGGRLFVENVHSLPGSQIAPVDNRPNWHIREQEAWFRQWNPEQLHPHLLNDGGRVWIFGFKTGEQKGEVVHARFGSWTEILGGVQNQTHPDAPADPAETVMLRIENSNVSAVFLERFQGVGVGGGFGWGNNAKVAVETQDGETRTLRPPTVYRAGGNTSFTTPVRQRPGQFGTIVPLFVSRVETELAAATPFVWEDGGEQSGFTISRGTSETSHPETVPLLIGGTAVPGVDYAPLPDSVTIPAGQFALTLKVTPIDNDRPDAPRTIVVSLDNGSSASLVIADDDFVAPRLIDQTLPTGASATVELEIANPTNSPRLHTFILPPRPEYEFSTSREAVGPAYVWEDITSTGTNLNLAHAQSSDPLPLGFTMPFYGQPFSSVRVSSKGFLSFTSGSSANIPQPLPDSFAPPNLIAPLWSDYRTGSGTVFWRQRDPETFVVQYDVPIWSSNAHRSTFQAHLKASGDIFFYYKTFDVGANAFSIGIQNANGTQGLQVARQGQGFESNQLAVRVGPPRLWLHPPQEALAAGAGETIHALIHFDANGLPAGLYQTSLEVRTDDPLQPALMIPVTLRVVAPPPSPLAEWRHLYFGTRENEGEAADDADPAGDGWPNLLEYALGGHPLIPATHPLITTALVSGHLRLTFDQRDDPTLRYVVEASDTLAPGSWSEVWASVGEQNVAGEVTVTDPVSTSETARRFLRLRVELR